MSAQGVPFTQALASEFSKLPGMTLVAGRYEGLDERVIESRIDREVSVGDYVLSGGEFPALVIIDAVARLIPGCSGTNAPRSKSPSTMVCSTGRITRGRWSSKAGRCPTYCRVGTTLTFSAGG